MDGLPCGCLDALAPAGDFDWTLLGTDALYGESSVGTCRTCGRQWLSYALEFEGFPRSGRWFRGRVRPGQAVDARNAPLVFADLPGYFAGGSFFGGAVHRRSGPAELREAPAAGPAFESGPSARLSSAPPVLPLGWKAFISDRDDGDPHFESRAAASPEGPRWAFTTRRVREGRTSVWVDGELLTQVPGTAVHVAPSWSADGRTLALWIVHLEEERSALVLIPDLRGEGEVVYRSDKIDLPEAPAWSPSGRSLAILRTRTPRHEFTKSGDPEAILLDAASGEYYPVCLPGEASGPLCWEDGRTLDAGRRRVRFQVPV
jgi:hypothetical protein